MADLLYSCDILEPSYTFEFRLLTPSSSEPQAVLFFEQSDRIAFKGIWDALCLHNKSMPRRMGKGSLILYTAEHLHPIQVTSALEWQLTLRSLRRNKNVICELEYLNE